MGRSVSLVSFRGGSEACSGALHAQADCLRGASARDLTQSQAPDGFKVWEHLEGDRRGGRPAVDVDPQRRVALAPCGQTGAHLLMGTVMDSPS